MKILVTGASGFLGAALAHEFLRRGHELSLLIRPTSSIHRLSDCVGHFRIGRCASDEDIRAFVHTTGPDAVIHTACSYGRSGETALQLADVNTRFAMLVLDAALSGTNGALNFINTGTALAPEVSHYALSKHHFAQWGKALAAQSSARLRFISIQLQHMYGPGDDPSKFATHVIQACHGNQPELALTAGEQARDFIYIDDVVSAYATVLGHADRLSVYEDIEVGSGQAPTIRDFVETVHRVTHSTTRLKFGAVPYRPNESMYCKADIRRMNELGWHPAFNLSSGLQKTIELEFSE